MNIITFKLRNQVIFHKNILNYMKVQDIFFKINQLEARIYRFISKSGVLYRITSQSFNPGQYLGKLILFDRNLSQLKRDVSAVPYNFCADFLSVS